MWRATFAVLVAASSAVAGPIANAQSESLPKPIHEASVKGVPVFSRGPLKAEKKITFFLSPTCNHCNKLYIEAMGVIRDKTSAITQSTEFTFFMYPRNREDIVIIATLLCVPEKRFVEAVELYEIALWDEFRGKAISTSFAQDASRKVANQYGVGVTELAQCIASDEIRSAIQSVYEVGRRYPHENVPIVVVNGKAQGIRNYSNAWSEVRPALTN